METRILYPDSKFFCSFRAHFSAGLRAGSLWLVLMMASAAAAQDSLVFDFVVFDAFGLDLPTPPLGNTYHISLADLDLDGDLDVVLTERQFTSLPSVEPVAVTYYRNDSEDPCEPQYVLVFGNPYNFDQNSIVQPVFVDIDADGDLDFFSGRWVPSPFDQLNFYENSDGIFSGEVDQIDPFNIDVSSMTGPTPEFCDIDADGDLDIFMGGEIMGSPHQFWFYENVGDPQSPDYGERQENPFNLTPQIGSNSFIIHQCADMDCDGDYDLLVKEYLTTNGPIVFYYYFQNVGTPMEPDFADPVTINLLVYDEVADLDGDGRQDILAANTSNVALFHKNITESPLCEMANVPVAGFSYEPTTGLQVAFTDQSEPQRLCETAWYWDFGDGSSWEEQGAIHNFAAEGTYTVCLTVTNPFGSDMICQDVKVIMSGSSDRQLQASATLTPNPVTDQLLVEFRSMEPVDELQLLVYDCLGKEIERRAVQAQGDAFAESVSTAALPAGVYTLVVRSKRRVLSRRFVKAE